MSTTSRKKSVQKKKPCLQRRLSEPEIRAIIYIATLLFAAFLAEKGVETSTIYGFLGMAIGAIYGKYFQNNRR